MELSSLLTPRLLELLEPQAPAPSELSDLHGGLESLQSSLGAAYMRNTSLWPDINAQAKEALRGPGFFDMPFLFNSSGYDFAHSMILGAQINQPKFNSSGAWQAFGPWEQAHGATFYPGVFDLRAQPSKIHPGSSVVMDHFVSYVQGATAVLKEGPF